MITAKELAKELGLSEAAVSLALNNKPGVSTQTRNRVKEAAASAGMDLSSRHILRQQPLGQILLVYYKKHGAVLGDTSFFSELSEGVEHGLMNSGYRMGIQNIYSPEDLSRQLKEYEYTGVSGAILLGTEMQYEDFMLLAFSSIPLVLLDNHFLSSKVDSVRISNFDGAYMATEYLINKYKVRPGYLSSAYRISNFDERLRGFKYALTHNGMSTSSITVHELTPSIDGAFDDMSNLLSNGEDLARCYFADNDLIAIGAMRALKAHGYNVPKDVSIIGFDDIPMCNYSDPPLTTVHVPKHYMGTIAAERLLNIIDNKTTYPINIEITPHLVKRESV